MFTFKALKARLELADYDVSISTKGDFLKDIDNSYFTKKRNLTSYMLS